MYMLNSRSRAGSTCQNRKADLVVSGVARGILLSSVVGVLPQAHNLAVYAVSIIFRCFRDRPEWTRIQSIMARNQSIIAEAIQ